MKNIFKIGKIIDKIFEISVLIKAVFGFFEILGGILLSFSKKTITNNFIIRLAQAEIADDPNDKDIIANYLVKTAKNLSQDSRIFAVAYLFFHGAVNIFLAVSLSRGKIRAYPVITGFLCIFIIYQMYKYFHTFSSSLLALTLFDIFFISVIWLEYRRKVKK